MSTIACDLYRINFKEKDLVSVLTELELLESFEPIEPIIEYTSEKLEREKKDISSKYNDVLSAVKSLSNIGNLKKTKKTEVSKTFLEKLNTHQSKLEEIVEDIADADKLFKTTKRQILEKSKKLEQLEEVKDSEVQINQDGALFNTRLLTLDVDSLEKIKYDIAENDIITLHPIKQVDKTNYILLAYNKAAQNLVNRILTNKKINVIEIETDEPKSIKNYYSKLQADIEKIRSQIEDAENKLSNYSEKYLDDLRSYADILNIQESALKASKYVGLAFDKRQALQLSKEHKTTIKKFKKYINKSGLLHIDGWIIPENIEKMELELSRISSSVKASKLDPAELSEKRSVMKNIKPLKPFEAITSFMGTPNSDEIDPSPFVAPFFVGFFGFALGDAGYGAVISLVSLFALFKIGLTEEQKRAVTLMLYCGFSTIFFGTLTGGWFGADLQNVGPIGDFLAQFKVFDISANIMLVLVGSLTIGFIHQIFGLLLKVYSNLRNGRIAEAIWVPSTWILLLFTIVGYALRNFANISGLPWSTILVAVLAVFVWGQGYGTKNILLRPLKGSMAIFNITGFLSNTLSYARLLALALATGVIASVVNLLATLFSGDIPVVSFIIASLILMLGHTFNLLLNLVGTFINVVRLHLVEFFPHFFEAKGVEFKPMKTELEYVNISSELNALDFGNLSK